jgi:hypothetical protein
MESSIILSNANIFDLIAYSDGNEFHNYIIPPSGTNYQEFKKLCEELLPQAAYQTYLKFSREKVLNYISFRDIVEELISLLKVQGYQRCDLPSLVLTNKNSTLGIFNEKGDCRLGFANKLIIEHNQKVENNLK